jgi:hypothetical protein
MRSPHFLLVALLAAACAAACTKVTGFSDYTFEADVDLATTPTSDLGTTLAQLGDPCSDTAPCAPPLFCQTGSLFPGGFCTRYCATNECAPARCGTVNGQRLCLPNCAEASGFGCRAGYDCCAGNAPTSGVGSCAPATSTFCGGK